MSDNFDNQQQQQQQGSGGDLLDKGVAFGEKKEGIDVSPSTTEKISDGIREGYKDVTGNDIPIQDKTYS